MHSGNANSSAEVPSPLPGAEDDVDDDAEENPLDQAATAAADSPLSRMSELSK